MACNEFQQRKNEPVKIYGSRHYVTASIIQISLDNVCVCSASALNAFNYILWCVLSYVLCDACVAVIDHATAVEPKNKQHLPLHYNLHSGLKAAGFFSNKLASY